MAEKVVSGQIGESNAHTRVATIELSTKVIDDEERLRSTLLHEMCHAAQWCTCCPLLFLACLFLLVL